MVLSYLMTKDISLREIEDDLNSAMLKQRHLTVSGTKSDLIERLKAYQELHASRERLHQHHHQWAGRDG
uniref:SAP domain-containing protein n=1 Tax=Gadus morhua TaxID=8049 RepID=A0A8C5B5H3_GADMO